MTEHKLLQALLDEVRGLRSDLLRAREPDPALRLLTAREFAALLGVDARTLRAMRHAGEVPEAITIGRSPRWSAASVAAWLAEQQP